jgi:hypothetical protein
MKWHIGEAVQLGEPEFTLTNPTGLAYSENYLLFYRGHDGQRRSIMARPIEATPILKGKDAEALLRRAESVVVTKERIAFLKTAALQSKKAEKDK